MCVPVCAVQYACPCVLCPCVCLVQYVCPCVCVAICVNMRVPVCYAVYTSLCVLCNMHVPVCVVLYACHHTEAFSPFL